MDRRSLLRLAAAAAALASASPRWAWSATLRQRDLFPLGSASGAPLPDGVVLWTRMLDGPVPGTVAAGTPRTPLPEALTVRWEVAEDDAFRRIVRAGTATALAQLGHAVHVEVTGLRPDRWYHYRFMHGDAATPAARTRTAPAADAMPARLRLAFASCQRWEQGHYVAHRQLADDAPDLVLFLGDYIYEYAMPKVPDDRHVRTHTLPLATTLGDYRDRYALYRTDPHLQAAHRACPWFVTWDDHEVQNDYAGLAGTGDAAEFAARRAAGYQAFYENMPLPASALARGLDGLGAADGVRVHRRDAWGRLLRLHTLDARQFRDPQACRSPGLPPRGAVSPASCPELTGAGRSFLGRDQERWVEEGLRQDAASGARWTVLAQQTLLSRREPTSPGGTFNADSWDGYPAARQRLFDAIRAAAPRNLVALGGDIHQNYVCRLLADAADPRSAAIGSEFCGTSVSSASNVPLQRAEQVVARNPHILLARPDRRGYALADVTPETWTTTLRVVDDVARADSAVSTLARFVVEDRVAGPQAA